MRLATPPELRRSQYAVFAQTEDKGFKVKPSAMICSTLMRGFETCKRVLKHDFENHDVADVMPFARVGLNHVLQTGSVLDFQSALLRPVPKNFACTTFPNNSQRMPLSQAQVQSFNRSKILCRAIKPAFFNRKFNLKLF